MGTAGKRKKTPGGAPITVGALDSAAVPRSRPLRASPAGAGAAAAEAPASPGRTPATVAAAAAAEAGGAAPAAAGRPSEQMIVPPAYREVQRLIEYGSSLVFVSGNAGTGKTTLIRYLRENVDRNLVVVAPTGVAALNAGGSTIHSFFGFPPRYQDPRDVHIPKNRRLYQALELLIVDEVSMLRADVLDCIDHFLRETRGDIRPFGGVQLLFLGDLFQLPPVTTTAEHEVLKSRGYASPYFFSAASLQDTPMAHVELGEVFRQTDPRFISLLNRLRVDEDTDAVVAELNRRCVREAADAGATAEDVPQSITLTCTNRQADEINATEMGRLETEEALFVGEVQGDFRLGGDRLPSPLELRLKEGARVMFTKNDEEGRWVNGSLGTVTWISGGRIEVELADGDTHEVTPVTWQTFTYRLERGGDQGDRIVAEEVGNYRQYPLMLAWAVTIHKSQGKTLGNVLVDFGWGTFASGQAYVALSRCRTMEGIRLARPLRPADVRCDWRIRRFYEALGAGVE